MVAASDTYEPWQTLAAAESRRDACLVCSEGCLTYRLDDPALEVFTTL